MPDLGDGFTVSASEISDAARESCPALPTSEVFANLSTILFFWNFSGGRRVIE
jgi:hypothetical protein